MMFNGDWLYNEALNYTNSGTFDSTFELGIMKTPVLEEAKEEYKDTSILSVKINILLFLLLVLKRN